MDFLFNLDRLDKRGLQKQLCDQISKFIMDGKIAPNVIMPSSRKLANQLGVSRNTVTLAYELLQGDGFLLSQERKGYYVNPEVIDYITTAHERSKRLQNGYVDTVNWQEKLNQPEEKQRNITKPKNWRDFKYSFIYGQTDPSLFPVHHWRECWKDAVSIQEITDWSQDRIDRDDPLLIEQIRSRLITRRGLWVDESEILVTVGAQNALYMAMKMLLNSDSTFGLEEPGYPDARNIANEFTSNLKCLKIDDQGLIIDDQLKSCDLVFTTPSHQSPTTVTMPIHRRQHLIEMAKEHDFLIIEDDYGAETNFAEAPLPALKSYDKYGRVIYLGSMSKTLAPGIRLGYLIGPKKFIQKARALRRLIMRHPPANNQRAIAYFLERGYYNRLLRNLTESNHKKWQLCYRLLQEKLPGWHILPTKSGSSFWLEGPKHFDTSKLMNLCMEDNALIETGDVHFHQHHRPQNCFRIGYSYIPIDRIPTGIDIIAHNVKKLSNHD
ncbi:PLP-dependent aminotransferase family protein [Kordiimonas sp. SCSIO 12610]|uniref:MocR-like pyridoxine biosynthesis transcription factor PdxR n=1 Tax=Kordiimonas sp. SCSIO 12610 TaxID=2829597 RepID=UPI00210E6BBE|nr:PLP-dependent aminotransferase family protein [Kordiimonas sp. SCSIO 12610]UTW54635.1 PLP-dependent aminotransferase family protein [Kordiimonas sp. SCSIO 12610]